MLKHFSIYLHVKIQNSLAYRRDGEKEDIMEKKKNEMVNIGISMPEEAYKQIFTSCKNAIQGKIKGVSGQKIICTLTIIYCGAML